MKKWLTSLFLIMALASGVLAGTPLHSGNMNSQMSDCCKKAKSKEQTREANIARLCCAVNCSDSSNTSQGALFNFSPSSFTISDSILKQIAFLIDRKNPVQTLAVSFERENISPQIQPKYIQHHSFLI